MRFLLGAVIVLFLIFSIMYQISTRIKIKRYEARLRKVEDELMKLRLTAKRNRFGD